MPVLSGFGHYFNVLRAALRHEREADRAAPNGQRAKGHELEFMPAALEVMETPASPLGRALALSICLFFVIAVAWASFGMIDIIATAPGKIIPSERVKIIQPLEAGVIEAIHVREGGSVKTGDVLIELNPTRAEADSERLAHDLLTARVETARLEALLLNNPGKAFAPPAQAPESLVALHRSYLTSQIKEHRAQQAALDGELAKRRAEIKTIEAEISRLEKMLPKIRERVEGRRKLVEKQVIARLSYNEMEEELFDHEGQLEVQKQRLQEARAAMRATKSRRQHVEAEFRSQVLGELAEIQQRATAIEKELIKAKERSRLQTLTAPTDGTVQQLAVHTVGGVVTPAQQLMVIVPAGAELEIEAMVLNKDIGFVHEGQEAELKIESFPFTRYGTIIGKVLHVSRDSVQDEVAGFVYPARVAMARTTMLVEGKFVNLGPGMAVTVEIKTGKRQVIEFLLAPLKRYQDESLKER